MMSWEGSREKSRSRERRAEDDSEQSALIRCSPADKISETSLNVGSKADKMVDGTVDTTTGPQIKLYSSVPFRG